MDLTISEIIIKFMKYNSIDTIYGIPGSNADFLNYFYNSKMKFKLCQDEKQGVYSAIGHYKSSGQIAACFGSVGGGVFNLVPGVISAYYESTPLLIIGSQISTTDFGKNVFQEASGISRTISQVNLFKDITLYSTILSEKKIYSQLKNALFYLRSSRPGPVYLELPKDVMNKKISFNETIFRKITNFNYKKKITKKNKRDIINLLKSIKIAKKPVILIGGGISKEMGLVIKKISKKTKIPIISTYKGKDKIDNFYDLYFGAVGIIGSKNTNNYLKESDLLIVIGASLNRNTILSDSILKNKQLFILDTFDCDRFKKNIDCIKYKLIKANLNDLLRFMLKEIDFKKIKSKLNEKDLKKIRQSILKEIKIIPTNKITKKSTVHILQKLMPPDSIYVSEDVLLIGKYFQFTQNNINITYTNLAPIGCALSGSIGAKNKNPNKWVVAILGDGGFNMALEEINTIFNSKFKKLLIIVFNNSSYGTVYKYQMYRYKQSFYTTFNNPDYSEIAKNYSLSATTVKKTDDLSKIIRKTLKNKYPTLINIIIDKNEKLKMNKYL